MPLPRRIFYGWFDLRYQQYRLSTWPPDSPVRASIGFDNEAELADYIRRKRGAVAWYPPLTLAQDNALREAMG